MASIAPALVAADFARLGLALETVAASGAPRVHLDVTDGHFLPAITMGTPVVACLRRATRLRFDVHLAIERPERFVAELAAAGADAISVPVEATPHVHDVLGAIRALGKEAGLALEPATSVDSVADALGEIDSLSILGSGLSAGLASGAGIAEAAFVPLLLAKLEQAARLRAQRGLKFILQAEGGVTPVNVRACVEAGADILVVDSAIFDSQDPKARLTELIALAGGHSKVTSEE